MEDGQDWICDSRRAWIKNSDSLDLDEIFSLQLINIPVFFNCSKAKSHFEISKLVSENMIHSFLGSSRLACGQKLLT